ncbi:hypothetical protein [Kitasatospora brasiliensis]|uniref:hypothetical protein n=1 Tax=Kitasatospora brasiliensis TaxID=3058040 RepID=UPI002931908E|nr:hypothetical protein [Kitasatospora sp. K002]
MIRGPYPFGDGMNAAWDLVVWHGDFERVEIATLSREDIDRVRDCFDHGDDVWMYNVYAVPDSVLPKIADLVPGQQLEPGIQHYIEARQNLPGGELWFPEPGELPPGHVPPP